VETFRDLALRPLRHAGDFRGRSRRQELIAFYVVVMGANLVAEWIGAWLGGWNSRENARTVCEALLLLPMLALFVRRLHDSGRRGAWVLLGLPGITLNLWRQYTEFRQPLRLVEGPWDAWALSGPAGLAVLILFALLLWEDDPEPNRYGANPRYDDRADETQPAARS
jgi:uncharacterized membrane protein YhaH (DUF805 family)